MMTENLFGGARSLETAGLWVPRLQLRASAAAPTAVDGEARDESSGAQLGDEEDYEYKELQIRDQNHDSESAGTKGVQRRGEPCDGAEPSGEGRGAESLRGGAAVGSRLRLPMPRHARRRQRPRRTRRDGRSPRRAGRWRDVVQEHANSWVAFHSGGARAPNASPHRYGPGL